MKICVTAVEALQKKGKKGQRWDELNLPQKLIVFLSFTRLNGNVYFLKLKKNLTPFMTKLRVLMFFFPYFRNNFNI
jgi:hypothetical protein